MKTFIHLRLSAFALLLILVVDNPIVAQNPGDNDSTFNPTDLGFGFEGGINESVITSAVQSDDKIVVAGSYQGIVRLNSDETTDKTFSARELSGRYIYSLAIQKDGKIIIGGTFTSYDKTSRNSIARLHPDGSLDLSFDPGIGPWGEKGKDNELMPALIYSIALQSDGKIIIGGYFTSYNGIPRNRLARLNPDGSLDLTFNPGNGGSGAGTIRAIVIQNDGKIIVGGDLGIARINTDGSLDKSLINGSNSYVYTLALQQDEKIIAGGSFTDPNNTSKKGIIRLNPDGTPDATFNTGSDIEGILAIALQNDGKIIAVGDFKSFIDIRHDMVRLNADGSVDGLFKPAGDNKKIYTCAILSNGKIVVGGDFAFYKGIVKKNLAVLKTDGTLDIPYIIGTGANDIVNGITYDKGKTIIWGRFTAYNGVAVTHVARLNPDGNPDINFHPETIPEEEITALMPQTDGKILIARRFSSGTHPPGVVIRLNSDGTLDPGFKMEKVIVAIYAIAVQPDGKIIVGGNFSYPHNNEFIRSLIRLNPDGTLDPTFGIGEGVNGEVNSIRILNDNKILIGGSFSTCNGTAINNVARLQENGNLDKTFNPGTGPTGALNPPYYNTRVNSILIQKDGKIIITGMFQQYNGTDRNSIARLNTDGSLDQTFDPAAGPSNVNFMPGITTSTLLSDDKIIIGGQFEAYTGIARNYVAKLNTDGSLDQSFNTGTGTEPTLRYVNSIAVQDDGRILIAGSFTSYKGVGRNRVARIWNGPLTTGIPDLKPEDNFNIYPNPTSGYLTIAFHKIMYNASIRLISMTGQIIKEEKIQNGTNTYMDLSDQVNGFYILEVREGSFISRTRLVKQ